MTRIRSLRKGSFTKLEVEKAIYEACERISNLFYSSIFKNDEGIIDIWDIELKINSIILEAIEKISFVDPAIAEVLSLETKRRYGFTKEILSSVMECLKDAFGSSIIIRDTSPRMIYLKHYLVGNKGFIQKEFKHAIYDVILGLIKSLINRD
ncbi:MAG: hypothetical protein DSO09_00555 [Candidatus Methanomethylicota archaeon]|uniref:Uncharacterized protein n=1 Tax=Thermoproteota archaeon TaxID=2056631 RepID=A0A520KGV5_9CREN|nr:MAG: hypothetical protein EF809_01265 [Candidatus Verstraetearchaeota archaeon]TDA40425.1 MAG: hypothetical protein DSO09_00555 [Candidatus Verstraetearchaeota archaeon]